MAPKRTLFGMAVERATSPVPARRRVSVNSAVFTRRKKRPAGRGVSSIASRAKVYSPAPCSPRWRRVDLPRTSKRVSSIGPAVSSVSFSSRFAPENSIAEAERTEKPISEFPSVARMRKRPRASLSAT